MKNTKKVLSGILALTMVGSLAACNDDGGSTSSGGGGGGGDTTTTEATTTTTAVTVEVNTAGLAEGEQELIENAMTQLNDFELENKEIRWLAHYPKNPGNDGQSKGVGVELFEQKYGAHIKDYDTVYEERYSALSTYILGGEGIDFFPGDDTMNFPKGVISGMFQPVDDYIDLNSAIWQNTKAGMEIFNFGGKHFYFVTCISAESICIYSKTTIDENGLEDPWELYEKGEWNWDTMKSMLEEFVDEENEYYGLDGWFYEKALYTSSNTVGVANIDGHMVSKLEDPDVEYCENFGYELFQKGLIAPFGGDVQDHLMGEGKELFLFMGAWGIFGDPATWRCKIPADDLGVAPTPSPAGSNPYCGATINGYALVKGAQNPEGVARFAECDIIAGMDEGTQSISDRKAKDDNHWSDEILAHYKETNELARQYPVYDFAPGCSSDIEQLVTYGSSTGLRAPFHGTSDWATQREALADTVRTMVTDVDNELQAAIAEFN